MLSDDEDGPGLEPEEGTEQGSQDEAASEPEDGDADSESGAASEVGSSIDGVDVDAEL